MRILLGVLSTAAAAALTTVLVAMPTAHADTGSCVSYLETVGQDTTARVQICAETETIGDTASQEAALAVCGPLMQATLLPPPLAAEACHRAVAP